MLVVRLWFLCLLSCGIQAVRILVVVPTPSISHQVVFRPLTQELAKRGHEVVVITTDPAFPKGEAPSNLREIDVHNVSYHIWREEFFKTPVGNVADVHEQVRVILEVFPKIFEAQVNTDEVQSLIKNEKFDLLILESCQRTALAYTHVYKVPVIHMSSIAGTYPEYENFGAPSNLFAYPTLTQQRVYNLTMWDKLSTLYDLAYYTKIYMKQEALDNKMIKRVFGHNTPDMANLEKNVDLLFLNVYPLWDDNRPVPPNMIYIGGIHQRPKKELPKNLKKDLDNSKHGVIYMSFGTNVKPSLLPPEKIQILIKALSKLPYDVLFKWDKDDIPWKADNVKISSWFPQSDLLRHPKIKVFVTQGGLQSTDEAINAGVPLIGIPLVADQWYNTEKYVHHGIGVKLEMVDITEDVFIDAINNVIGDKSYRQNMVWLRSVMLEQPQSALDRAVWWTEHLIKHGSSRHLRARGSTMTYAQYYNLDLLFTLLLCTLGVIIVSLAIVLLLFRLIVKILFRVKVKTA